MKIFFMDIDGPMLPEKSYSLPENKDQRIKFDNYAVQFVNYFLNNGFQLVISSAWQVAGKKYISDLLTYNNINPDKLHKNWCTDIYTEKVPVEKGYYQRHEEIQLWLDNNKTDTYIAVDGQFTPA